MKKRILAAVLAALLIFTLSGCGKSGQGGYKVIAELNREEFRIAFRADDPLCEIITAAMQYESGVLGTLHINSDSLPDETFSLVIYGTEGIVYMGNGKLLVSWFTHSREFYQNVFPEYIVKYAPEQTKKMVAGGLEDYNVLPEEVSNGGCYVRISDDYGGETFWGETIK